jgi:transposase
MVYCHISKELKERALWLISDGYAPEDICKLFDISQRSVSRWKQNDHLYGTIIPPPNPIQCCPRILNSDMMHDLYTLLQKASEMYLCEIQDWIALAFEVHISRVALHQNIHDTGITFKLLRRAAAEHNEDLQQEWKQEVNAHFMASQMVFINETSKDERTIYRHYGRSIAGTRTTISANFVQGERYSMATTLLLDRYEAVHIVLGSVDREEFLDFIVNNVVHFQFYPFDFYSTICQLPNMNPYPQDKSILILDNCVIHKTCALQEIVEGSSQVLLFLLPYSPDFNPIEKSFSCSMSLNVLYANGYSCLCSKTLDSKELAYSACC